MKLRQTMVATICKVTVCAPKAKWRLFSLVLNEPYQYQFQQS